MTGNMTGTMCINIVADYKDSLDDWFQIGQLKSWHACIWGKDWSRWGDGKTVQTFWNWLYHWSLQIKSLQVYGWDMWRSWCVLNFIKETAEGRLVLNLDRDYFVVADTPTVITCRAGENSIMCIDIANLGIEKKDYDIREDNRAILPAAKMAIQDYRAMCKKWDMGMICLTSASQCWQIFLDRYPLPLSSPPSAVEMEMAAYFNGRCECRRIGEINEKLYLLDISSMYTSIGLNALFPMQYECSRDGGFDNTGCMAGLIRIADVTVKTQLPYYPARETVKLNRLQVPSVGTYGERIIYPIGEFRTILCEPELLVAIANNHITKVHKVQYYHGHQVMRDWSIWALKTRAEIGKDDKLRRLHKCFKRIMNSLPGKWGQKNATWINYPAYDSPVSEWSKAYARHPITRDMTVFRTIAGRCQYFDRVEIAEHARLAVADFWTSYGRVLLLQLLCVLGADELFYYDTDNVAVNSDGLQTLLDNGIEISSTGEPGKLRLVNQADSARFVGIRKYLFGGEWHCAGTMPDEEEEEMKFWQGGIVATKHPTVVVKDRYNHGIVTDDGIVKPFNVGGLE